MADASAASSPTLSRPAREQPLDPAVRVERLSRSFGPVVAIEDATLEAPSGAITGLLGTNGAGKTTMLRILLGLISPDAGRVRVLGRDPTTDGTAVRTDCGTVLEHDGLYERLSGRENLEFHARIWRLPDRARRIDDSLARFELDEHADRPSGDYSRGMRRRLALIRALLHDPPLLLLDEPTAGLDPRARAVIHERLTGLADTGRTILLATHDLAEAESLCHNVAVMHAGHIVFSGPTAQLHAASDVVISGHGLGERARRAVADLDSVLAVETTGGELRLRLATASTPTSAIAALLRAGAEIEEVRRERPSLEKVFFELTQNAAP